MLPVVLMVPQVLVGDSVQDLLMSPMEHLVVFKEEMAGLEVDQEEEMVDLGEVEVVEEEDHMKLLVVEGEVVEPPLQ